MSSIQQRTNIITLFEAAVKSGARRHEACKVMGISHRTLQRWKPKGITEIAEDKRPDSVHPTPHNKLSDEEVALVLNVCNQAEYYSGPQSQDKKYYEFKMVSFSTAEQRCPVSSFKSVTFDLP